MVISQLLLAKILKIDCLLNLEIIIIRVDVLFILLNRVDLVINWILDWAERHLAFLVANLISINERRAEWRRLRHSFTRCLMCITINICLVNLGCIITLTSWNNWKMNILINHLGSFISNLRGFDSGSVNNWLIPWRYWRVVVYLWSFKIWWDMEIVRSQSPITIFNNYLSIVVMDLRPKINLAV